MRAFVIPFVLCLSACATKTAEPEIDFRATAPAPLERSVFTLPAAQEATLSNGLEVRYVQDASIPMTRVTVAFRLGSFADPENQTGLVRAAFDMLNEGVEGFDALEISSEMKRLGASLSSSAGLDGGYVSINSLTRSLDESLVFLSKALMSPTFDGEEFERIRKTYLQNLQKTKTTPRDASRRVLQHALYGGQYAGSITTEESITALSVDDMSAWWNENALVENAMVVATGDLPLEELLPKLETSLSLMKRGEPVSAPAPKVAEREETEILFLHKAGAAQSVLRMGVDTQVAYGHEDYWALRVANAAFGGMFMSRLNMNLREDKGYTYGARSWTIRNYGTERWEVSTSVRTDATAASLFEIFKELSEVAGEAPARSLSADEIQYAQSSSVNGYPAQFETPNTLLQQLSEIWRYGLPADAVEAYIANVESVEPKLAQQAFAKRVADRPLLVVVVGDWEVVGESVTALGYPVRQVDVDGQPLEQEQ